KRARGTRIDVFYQRRSCGGPVALPEFEAVSRVEGREKDGAVDVGQLQRVGAKSARENVVDEDCASRCSIALPQLVAVSAVVGGKKQYAIDVRQPSRIRVIGPRMNVLNQNGPRRRTVAHPQ